MPTIVSTARWSSGPTPTIVAGLAATKPPFCRPMNVSSRPMPAAEAARRCVGIAIASDSRSGVADTTRKITPAQKTMPSATGHGTPPCRMIV